jgi:Zn-dependent protease with chaperone function
LLQFLREKEMRDSLGARARDPVVLGAQYLEYAETGENDLFLRAVENAPMPLLTPDTLTKGRQLQLMHQHPELAEKLPNIRAAQSYLHNAVAGIKRQVCEHAGIEPQTVMQGGEADGQSDES